MTSSRAASAAQLEGGILLARGVVGADTAGPRMAPRGAVFALSLALGRGIHAILGAPEDGTIALGDLVSGRIAPSRGTLTVAGRSPARDASLRKRIAHLAHAPDLPDARDVATCLDIACRARGGGDASSMLERIGAGKLLARRLPSLTHGEARAVDAAIALSASCPLVLCVHEPFADVGPASASAIESVLRERASEERTVIVLTSTPRDAARLADDVLVLDRGRLVRGAGAGGHDLLDPPLWPHARPRRMELIAHVAGAASQTPPGEESPVRAIARRLSANAAISSVSWEEPPHGERGPSTLRIAGPDESACALALLDAADAEQAAIVGLSPVPATLVEVRMATEQLRIAANWQARMHAMTTANAMTLAPPQQASPQATSAPASEAEISAVAAAVPVASLEPVEPLPAPSESSLGESLPNDSLPAPQEPR